MKPRHRWPLIDRLKRKLETDERTGCWNFTGAKSGLGYGLIGGGGKGGPMLGAHRAAWQEMVGPIPPGHHIHHVCQNRACCNPDHLRCVSVYEHHQIDRQSNVHKTHCRNGHPYSGDNLVVVTGRNGNVNRICRTCRNANARRAWRKKHGSVPKEPVFRTHCRRGHPLTGDNLSPVALMRGRAVCKTCANQRAKQYYHKNIESSRAYIREYQQKRRAMPPAAPPEQAV